MSDSWEDRKRDLRLVVDGSTGGALTGKACRSAIVLSNLVAQINFTWLVSNSTEFVLSQTCSKFDSLHLCQKLNKGKSDADFGKIVCISWLRREHIRIKNRPT